MGRFGDIILLILVLLIVLSPVLWLLGFPLDKVAVLIGYWIILWLLTATIGRVHER